MRTRKDIVEALRTVPGIEPYVTAPKTIHPFDAWPTFQLMRPRALGPCTVETDWIIYVALPAGDLAETVETADELWMQIFEALMYVGAPTEAAPDRISTGEADGAQPVMRFTFISD